MSTINSVPGDFQPLVDLDLQPESASQQDESLFARGLDGQLIRLVPATAKDFDADVSLIIDGREMTVKKAVPIRDSQGIILRNDRGEAIPRPTTIYDAVSQLYVQSPGDQNPIPTLCHREHMHPVGVCRVCLVEIQEIRPSGRPRKAFVPSCTYHVKEGMIISTLASPDNPKAVESLNQTVGIVVELLASEHLTAQDREQVRKGLGKHESNELKKLVARFSNSNETAITFPPSERFGVRGQDHSSEIIEVNHDACILCQRCHRACVEIKHNDVISRTGKGYATKISFDLDQPMQESSCVSCGECVISCPTDALTFRPEVIQRQSEKLKNNIRADSHSKAEVMPIEELMSNPLFEGIPRKFLEFNGNACLRRKLSKDEILCRQGDYGSTAFIIQSGRLEIIFDDSKRKDKGARPSKTEQGPRGIFAWLSNWNRQMPTESVGVDLITGTDLPSEFSGLPSESLGSDGRSPKKRSLFRDKRDVIVGEMACLNRYPRGATMRAAEESEVIEIGSNVLYMLQRNASSRKVLNDAYRKYALNSNLEKLAIFETLSDQGRIAAAKVLAEDVELMSVEPGQPIFREGEEGTDFFLVRLGYVKVSRMLGSKEQVVNYIGPERGFWRSRRIVQTL